MSLLFRKSAAALLAALLLASALSGCFKIHKIDSPSSPDPAETLAATDPASDPAGSSDGISVVGKPGKTDAGEPTPEPEPEPVSIDYALLEDAIAIGLTGNGADYLRDENGLWHVVGLYAALLARVGDRQMGAWLSDRECDALAATLLPDEDPPGIPDAWFSDGGLVREDMNGTPGVSFPSYEEYLGSMLGIWREVRHPDDNEDASYAVEVVDHLDDGVWHTFFYIAIAEDPTDGQNKLVSLVIGDTLLEASSLPFNLGDVRGANRISSLLTHYDTVTLDMSDQYSTDFQTLWLRDGDMAFYEVNEVSLEDDDGEPMIFHSENGAYRDLEFNTYLMGEPMINIWVTAKEQDPGDVREYYDTLLTCYIPDDPASEIALVSEDDETWTFTVDERYEGEDGVPGTITDTFTVAKDTLAILSCSWAYENGYVAGSFTVSYNGNRDGEEVMKAWDKTRTLTFDIKTEAGGARTETVAVPDSWLVQLLVDEGITVCFDEACTDLTYNLLDAGGDTTLWARDEANTPAAKIDISSVTLENVIAANYLIALTERYKSVKIRTDTEYTDTDAWFFPDGGSVVQLIQHVFKASGTSSDLSGSTGDLDFFVEDDGSVFARGVVRAAPAVTPDPEYDAINTYLIDRLRGGTLDELAETDAGYTFRVSVPSYADNSPYIYRCTADKDTLALTEIREEGPEAALLCTVEYGGELPALADTYTAAMRKVRTVTYHASRDGKTYDTVFRVPADWSFYADTGDNALYADAGYTVYAEGSVPADGRDYEFWTTDGMHAAGTDGLSGTPADLPGFAIEDLIAANYLTVLLPQYGQVKINQTFDYGSDYMCYFPFRDTVAYYGEGRYVFDGEDENTRFGSDGDISYDIAEDGTVSGYAYADTASGEDYIAYNSDAEGRFFPDNAYLTSSLYGCVITDIEEQGDVFVVHTRYAETAEGEDPFVQTYTVDRETLAIRSYAIEGTFYRLTVDYGEGLNPYEDTFRKAMADTRTVTYHIHMDGESFDRVYEVPKSWTFSLRIKEEMRFFKDKGLTDPIENLVPADRWNHEIWVTDARG